MHKRAREFSRRSVHRSGDKAFVVGPTYGGGNVALKDKRAVLLNSTRSLK